MDTLAFGYILPTTGRIRDFNPLETCAARRTYIKKLRLMQAWAKLFIFDVAWLMAIAKIIAC